eukprot:scaffold16510_cov49-Attheya_sp.AAC.2
MCEEEWDVEVALSDAVARCERAGDPIIGSEACQMALRFSLDLENCRRARQVNVLWKELISCTSDMVHCEICERCANEDPDGKELAPWFTQKVVGSKMERHIHVCGVCMWGQCAMVRPDMSVTVITSARWEGSSACSQNSERIPFGRPFGDSSGSTLWRAFTSEFQTVILGSWCGLGSRHQHHDNILRGRSFGYFDSGILEVSEASSLLDPMIRCPKG